MSIATTPANKASWLAILKGHLRDCRTSPYSEASSDAFYIVLGMISAARLLDAISSAESDRLRELNLTAWRYRSHELLDGKAPHTHRPTPATPQEHSA